MRRGCPVALLTGLLWASPTMALDPVRLQYEAPVDCPGEKTFFDEVLARTKQIRPAQGDESATLYRVILLPQDDRFAARLEAVGPQGDLLTREVVADTCAEAASALALTVALSIEQRSLAPNPATATPPPSERLPMPQPPVQMQAPPNAPQAPPTHWMGGVGAMGVGAAAPEIMFGVAGNVEALLPNRLKSSLMLSGFYASVDTSSFQDTSARFRLVGLRLTACPVAVSISSWFFASPCLGGEAGALRGAGSNVVRPRSSTGPWTALDLAARLRLMLPNRVAIEADGVLFFPVVRDTFVFEMPNHTVHKVPSVGGSISLGLGIRFL